MRKHPDVSLFELWHAPRLRADFLSPPKGKSGKDSLPSEDETGGFQDSIFQRASGLPWQREHRNARLSRLNQLDIPDSLLHLL